LWKFKDKIITEMKRVFSFSLLLLICLSIHSQVKPEAFIGLLPAIPSNAAVMSKEQQDVYLSKVDELTRQVKTEMERRDKNIEASMQSKEETAMKQNNVNGIDPRKLAAMSDAERQAWAKAYAASTQGNPAKAQKHGQQDRTLYELMNQQKKLTDSLDAISLGFAKEFGAIEDDTERQALLEKINSEESEIMSNTGIVSDRDKVKVEALILQVKAEKEQYSNKYVSKYTEILRRIEAFTRKSLPAYYRLERISNDLSNAQNGVMISDEQGAMGISTISGYLSYLSGIFKYKID
jgi:hypothetical protein